MKDKDRKLAEEIAKDILRNEYSDYNRNSWHYEREFKMLTRAMKIFHDAKMKEITEGDIEAWAGKNGLSIIRLAGAKMFWKAFRNGEIKHQEK